MSCLIKADRRCCSYTEIKIPRLTMSAFAEYFDQKANMEEFERAQSPQESNMTDCESESVG